MARATSRFLKFRIQTLIGIVALVALILGSGRYWQENRDLDQSWTSRQIYRLDSKDRRERIFAAEALGEAKGDQVDRARLALLITVKSSDPLIRSTAIRSLGKLAELSPPVYGEKLDPMIQETALVLANGLSDSVPGVRLAAAEALRDGPVGVVWSGLLDDFGATQALTDAIDDPEPTMRAVAVRYLGKLSPKDSTAPTRLLKMLDDPDPDVRYEVYLALAHPWTNAEAVASNLVDRFGQTTEEIDRQTIPETLKGLDVTPPKEAIPLLVEAYDLDAPSWTREAIAEVLSRYGPVAREALPRLGAVATLNIENLWAAFPAIQAITAIDPDSPEAQALLDPLVELLLTASQKDFGETDLYFARSRIARELASYGPSARHVAPDLREAHKQSTSPFLRIRIQRILSKIDPPSEADSSHK